MRICVKIHLVFDTMADDHKPQVHNPANNEDNKHDHFHTETFHICHRTESSLRTREGFLDPLLRLPVVINGESSDTYFSFSQWHFQKLSPTVFFLLLMNSDFRQKITQQKVVISSLSLHRF